MGVVTRIVCGNCQRVLRKGDQDAPTEFKVCTDCIILASPGSTPEKVNDFQEKARAEKERFAQMEPPPMSKTVAEAKYEDLLKRFSKLDATFPYQKYNGEWCLLVRLHDYYKRHLVDVPLPLSMLKEIVEQLEEQAVKDA